MTVVRSADTSNLVGGVELMGRPPLPPGTRTIDSHGYVREKQPEPRRSRARAG